MFSYVFCDDMMLICDSPPSRHGLMLLSSWGFGLYSSRRNLPAQAGLKFWMIWKCYMWTAEWRIKWRMIIAAVIYATSCSCEKKTAMIIPHLITSRIVGQQIKKRFSSFSTSTVTLYFVSPGGKGGSKNYQEIKKGAELIQLLLTGVGGGGGSA